MRKKWIAGLLVIVMIAAFSGCGSSGNSDISGDNQAAGQTEKDEDSSEGAGLSGNLSIWSWGADAEKAAREEMVEVFQKAHPELDVEHVVLPTADSVWDQKSTAAYAAGNAGDVMQMSPDYYGLMSQNFEDLNPYIEKEGVDLDAVLSAGMLNGYYRPGGKLDAMPLLANTFVFAYNKDMFDQFDVEYPTDDWTWDDLAEMAPGFVSGEGVNKTYALVNHWVNPNFALISKGGIPYTDDFKTALVDSAEVAAGLDLFGELVQIGAMPDDVAAKNLPKEQLFVSGKAAIYPMGGFEISSVSEEIGDSFQWDAVLPPKDTVNQKNTNVTYATGYAMNVAAKNKDAAWQFLKEMCYENEEMAKVTAKVGMPGNKKIAESDFSSTTYGAVSNQKYVEGLATSRLNIWGGALSSAGDQWRMMWESVTINGSSAADAQAEYFSLVQNAFEELNIDA